MSAVFFITHPDVAIDPTVPAPDWPLNDRGRARMRAMVASSWIKRCAASLPAASAKRETGPRSSLTGSGSAATASSTTSAKNDRLATGYLPEQEFDATVDAFFAHPQTSVRGWEPAADAQARIIRAVEQIASQAGNGDLAIVGHGGTGTLLDCHLAGLPIDRRYDQPATSGGNWFAFNAVTRKLMVHGWHSIDATGQEGTSPAAAAGRAWGVNTDDSS